MAKKTKSNPKDSSYSAKRRHGLVPHYYDFNSRSYHEGAWKHWRGYSDTERARQGRADTQNHPATGHQFTGF